MSVSQGQFIKAMLEPNSEVPNGLYGPDDTPAGKRFSVYRNNVASSLIEALEVSFPVLRKLVGDEFFRAMAGVFLRQYQPNTPMLMYYGDEMPEFLRSFEPANIPYLPDIARLELAQRYAYHAADVAAIDPADLQALGPDDLTACRLKMAPALHLIRSDYPIVSIWKANMQAGGEPQIIAQDALITRPEFDPEIIALPAGGGAFMQALISGKTLGVAIKSANIASGDFNLTKALGLLLSGGAITEIY